MTQLPESSSQVLGIRNNYPQFALLKSRKAELMTMSTKFSQKPRQNYTRIPEQNLKHTNFSKPCFPPQIFPRGILNAVLTTLPELFSEIRNCFALSLRFIIICWFLQKLTFFKSSSGRIECSFDNPVENSYRKSGNSCPQIPPNLKNIQLYQTKPHFSSKRSLWHKKLLLWRSCRNFSLKSKSNFSLAVRLN